MPRYLVCLCLFAASGCDADAQGLSWFVEFGAGVAEDDAVHFEASITEGGCREEGMSRFRTEFGRGDEVPGPTRLAPGAYAFHARVMNDDCVWYGIGCAPVTLPVASAEVITILVGPTAEDACPGQTCVAGSCMTVDAALDSRPDTPRHRRTWFRLHVAAFFV